MKITSNHKTIRDKKYKMTYKIRQVKMQKLMKNDWNLQDQNGYFYL